MLANSRRLLIDRLLKGRKGEGDTAQARFLLAEVYHLNLNQDSTALSQYQKVADSFPQSDYAAKALYAAAWIKHNRLKSVDSIAAYQAVIDRYPRTVYAQEARRVLGKPLLPASQIERPPEVKAESLRLQTLRDSAVVRQARADSLERLALASPPDTLKREAPEPIESPTSARAASGAATAGPVANTCRRRRPRHLCRPVKYRPHCPTVSGNRWSARQSANRCPRSRRHDPKPWRSLRRSRRNRTPAR